MKKNIRNKKAKQKINAVSRRTKETMVEKGREKKETV